MRRIGYIWTTCVLLGCAGTKTADPSLGETKQAVTGDTSLVAVAPAGVLRGTLAVSASSSLKVGDRSKIVDASGAPASIASLGTGTLELGADSNVGDLWSKGPLFLRDRAKVSGSAEVAGTVTKQNATIITGGVVLNPTLASVAAATLGATFGTACGGNVSLEPDKVRTLSPDAYGDVSVKAGATLTLKSGNYTLNSFQLESLAKLALDVAAGPVVLFVKSGFTFRGSVSSPTDATQSLLIEYAGTSTASIEAPFQGTIVAPNARLNLATVQGAGHRGSFFAKDIEVFPDAKITFKPFAWDRVLPTGALRVTGRVSAAFGSQRIAVPGALTELQMKVAASCGSASYRVVTQATTDADGFFGVAVPSATSATLRLCSSAPGFASSCQDLDPKTPPQTLVEMTLGTPTGAVHGLVRTGDGSPCGSKRQAFDTNLQARVDLRQNASLLRTLQVNASGEYVAPLPGAGSYALRATCAARQVERQVTVASSDLGSGVTLDLMIANRAPKLRAFSALHADGTAALTAAPGETLRIRTDVYDPDGDPLTFKYRDLQSGALGAATSELDYVVPAAGALRLWVEISDGSGGFAYGNLSVGSSAAGNRFIGTLAATDGTPLGNRAIQVKSFRGDTLLDAVSAVTDTDGGFRSALGDADRFVVSFLEPGLRPEVHVFDRSAGGVTLRTSIASEHLVANPTNAFTVRDELLDMDLEVPSGALVDAAGFAPTGPVRVLMDRDRDGTWRLGSGVAKQLTEKIPFDALAAARVSIVDASDRSRIFGVAPGKLVDILYPVGLEDDGLRPISVGQLGASGFWEVVKTAPAVFGRRRLSVGDIGGPVGLLTPSKLGVACIRTKVDRETMVVPLTVTLSQLDGTVIRTLTINDYEYHSLEFGKGGYYKIHAEPSSPSLVPGHDQFEINHQVHVLDAETPPGYLFGTCETRNDLFVRDIPEHERYLSRGPENDKNAAVAYYDEVSARSRKSTLDAFKTVNGFGAGDAVEARFYNRNELGIGRKLTCRKDSSVLACYLVKYGDPGGPVDESLDDLMNDTNPDDTVAMDWTRSRGVRFYVYAPSGQLKYGTHFDLEGEKYVPGVCQGCHGGLPTFVPVDPTTHLYRNKTERNAASEPIRKINQMIFNTPGAINDSIRDYITRLYPSGVATAGAKAVDQMPPLYTDAGREDFYTDGIKPYCQLCHLSSGRPDWTTSSTALTGLLSSYACRGDAMPHGFVSHRNLWVGGALAFAFGCEDWEPPASITENAPPVLPVQCAQCPCEFWFGPIAPGPGPGSTGLPYCSSQTCQCFMAGPGD
jgi:hypothetical protein